MVTISGSDEFGGAQFVETSLRGARFINCDLSGVVMRAVQIEGTDIDAPWLTEDGASLHVNGVDVAPLIEGELNRRFPGRAERCAEDPDGLRAAWASVQDAWSAALDRAASMPEGTVDISVDGEWTFAQTLRHLVMATDVWLRQSILRVAEPLHPLGQPHVEYETDGYDMSVFDPATPSYAEVLTVRAGRVAMVRDFFADVTLAGLAEPRANPWDPGHEETVRSCLYVILHEEWEHLRFALRDLDAITSRR